MLIGRNNELDRLLDFYDRENSQIVVVYGAKYIGKTALIKEFMTDKPGFYYKCEEASEREQHYRFGNFFAEKKIKTLRYPDFKEIFKAFGQKHSQKKVLVFDEFQNLIKACPDFMEELISFIHSSWNNQEYLVILSSSSIEFVENTMVSKIKEAAFELSGFLKVKELTFNDLREYFSLYSNEDCLTCWSCLGGVPGLWKMFDEKASVKDNIVNKIIAPEGPLHNIYNELVFNELREMGIYNTILSSLSDGLIKLNDLYEHTGFSRAKISVYLKNLIELELVEKVFSIDTDGRENSLKGIYGISNKFVDFYFSFIYKNASFMEEYGPGEFYSIFVAPYLKAYVSKYYGEVCLEYMLKANDRKRLPIKIERFGTWLGKNGNIDIVMADDSNKVICGLCIYDKAMFTYEDYLKLLENAKAAKLTPDYIYLFTNQRFDEKLSLEGKVRKNIKLLYSDDL